MSKKINVEELTNQALANCLGRPILASSTERSIADRAVRIGLAAAYRDAGDDVRENCPCCDVNNCVGLDSRGDPEECQYCGEPLRRLNDKAKEFQP